MIFLKFLSGFFIVVSAAVLTPVLLNAQPQGEIEMRVSFLPDGFDNEPNITPFTCMRRTGVRSCYRLALKLPSGFGARFDSKIFNNSTGLDLEIETVNLKYTYVYMTMPPAGGTVTFYASENEEMTAEHIFPPDEPGMTLHFDIDIKLQRMQTRPEGVALDGTRTRRTLRDRSRSNRRENTETENGIDEVQELTLHTANETQVYENVDKEPVLIEGYEAFQERLIYPEKAKNNGIEGVVHLEFIVNKQGLVEQPEVIRSLSEETDQEALRMIREAKFEPGILNGRPVNVRYILPVYFNLSD